VVFAETPEEKDFSMAARIKAAQEPEANSTVKVRVRSNYRVVEKGVPHTGGDVLEVLNDQEHDIWIKSGWVELVKDESK
jgi:hypothetical protein